MENLPSALIIITLLVSAVVLIFGGHPWWALFFVLLTSTVGYKMPNNACSGQEPESRRENQKG